MVYVVFVLIAVEFKLGHHPITLFLLIDISFATAICFYFYVRLSIIIQRVNAARIRKHNSSMSCKMHIITVKTRKTQAEIYITLI